MMTYTLPPHITTDQHPQIETISKDICRSYNVTDNKSSTYYLSRQDIDTPDDFAPTTISKFSIFQEYFLMKTVETLYDSIKKEQQRFLNENVDLPNQHSIKYACQVINVLSEQNIYPNIITPTIEEGICLTFHKAQYRLFLEFYNNGEIGYIIEDTFLRKTIENEDLSSVEQVPTIIEKFFQ